jgi:hypothetical protein
VPDVGDESSSWEEVSAFYDFWYGFKSWREFPHPGMCLELPTCAYAVTQNPSCYCAVIWKKKP